ncbi:MAG: hypothetical protein LBV54_01155 [Puniceicoccales bacterium]|jgi:hypothetical protein|nr:hypothetical protein [Puniceicoccales bacterium]
MNTSILKDTRFTLVSEFAKPDSKKRLSLGAALTSSDRTSSAFNVYCNTLGQIILDPVQAIPESEAWLFANKEALEAVRVGLTQSANGETHDLGSFAEIQ